jgi:hypothetical protein
MKANALVARVRRSRTTGLLTIATALSLGARRATFAQDTGVAPLITLGSDAEDRLRLGQLLGTQPAGFLLKSASRLSEPFDSAASPYAVLRPEVRAVHNSELPFSLNQGPMWASVGWNESVLVGGIMRDGRVTLIAAPQFLSEQNLPFQAIPYSQSPPRSRWANPYHPPPESIDLPLRFGDRPIHHLDPGQSSLTVDAGGVAFGAATENLWWGPGIRNAITLSDNAPGFPHFFAQTRQPAHTRAGTFDVQYILGQLSESGYFDTVSTNNNRSLNGLALTWGTPFDSSLTVGFARLVMGTETSGAFPFSAALDVLGSAGHIDGDTTKPIPRTGRAQITSLFARWLVPGAGFEAYAEWARFEEPISLRDFLEFPGHSEGYTLGFQWAHPMAAARAFQLQGELSYLEPDPSLRVRWTPTTYTSRAVPQGFTQNGRVLGAAIGPGSSSQWLAGDLFAPRWRVGSYLGRIRWDNGVQFERIVPNVQASSTAIQIPFTDVSLFAGVRGSVSWKGSTLLVDFTHGARFNYLFQAYQLGSTRPGFFDHIGGVDLVNNTLSVTLSSALPHS